MVVLPEGIRGEVEGFGEGRAGGTDEPKPEGFAVNAPGPKGFPSADVHFVWPLGRSTITPFATLRVVRLAGQETELTIPNLISL